MSMQRLLLVDDEESLLRLMEKFLKRAGYEVDSCGCAEDAWRLFSAKDKAYAVVILDLSLPDMPGDQLLIRMRRQRPGIRAVICSGLPPLGAAALQSDELRYLQKPFLPRMLIEAVVALAD
jgi:two-component system response regulator AtoC